MKVRLSLQPLAKEKKQGVWEKEKKQEEQCCQGKRNVLDQGHICIMDPNHFILVWVVENSEGECSNDCA